MEKTIRLSVDVKESLVQFMWRYYERKKWKIEDVENDLACFYFKASDPGVIDIVFAFNAGFMKGRMK